MAFSLFTEQYNSTQRISCETVKTQMIIPQRKEHNQNQKVNFPVSCISNQEFYVHHNKKRELAFLSKPQILRHSVTCFSH